MDPFHNVVFGGELQTEVDFGGGPLPLLANPDEDTHGFVVELSASGDHVFSKANGMRAVTAIASNGARVVVSGSNLGGAGFHPRLQAYDAAGTQISLQGSVTMFETFFELGVNVDALAIGASGRIWWSLRVKEVPLSYFNLQPYLLVRHE